MPDEKSLPAKRQYPIRLESHAAPIKKFNGEVVLNAGPWLVGIGNADFGTRAWLGAFGRDTFMIAFSMAKPVLLLPGSHAAWD